MNNFVSELQPPLPYPDNIKKEETTITPEFEENTVSPDEIEKDGDGSIKETVTEIVITDNIDGMNDLIDTIQSVNSPASVQNPNETQNEIIQKQIIPEEDAFIVSELWKTMDKRFTMEFRNVHNRLKQITHKDLTTGQARKYLKYCKAVEIKNRKKRYQYLPDRDKWTLSKPKPENSIPKKPKYEGPYTFADAVFRADEERESKLYDEEVNSSNDENTETE